MVKKSVEPTVEEELDTLVEEKVVEKKEEQKEEPKSFSKEELKEGKTPFYKPLLWMIVPVVLLMGAVVSGVFIYNLGLKKGMETTLVQATPTPQLPSPTPAPKLAREDLKIHVLNGAGIAGTASKAKEFLEGLGYKDIDTGNADSFDFEETEIALREEKKDYFDLLKEDLDKEYFVAEDLKSLEDESEYDAVVTIGKEKAE